MLWINPARVDKILGMATGGSIAGMLALPGYLFDTLIERWSQV